MAVARWLVGGLMTGRMMACGEPPEPVVEAPPEPPESPAPLETPPPPDDPLAGLSLADRELRLQEIGEVAYGRAGAARCAVCHGEDGLGLPGAIPSLRGPRSWVGDCFEHAAIVLYGLHETLVRDGFTYVGVMPPQADLDDLQIAAVTTYVNQQWGNAGPVCWPHDVAIVRLQGPMSPLNPR